MDFELRRTFTGVTKGVSGLVGFGFIRVCFLGCWGFDRGLRFWLPSDSGYRRAAGH